MDIILGTSAMWFGSLLALCPVLPRCFLYSHSPTFLNADGEVLAWDNSKQETVPFGSNRTVAKFRQKYMKERGLCDKRDVGLHEDDTEHKAMNASNTRDDKKDQSFESVGAECWLLFVAFDVVYIDGPGAADLLSQSVSQHITPRPKPGSIIKLDSFERKKLLYRLIDVQKNEVEIVSTVVVRPDGGTAEGSEYFAPKYPVEQYGFPAYTLDSIDCALHNVVPGLQRIDIERRRGLSDQQISQCRANAVDKKYKEIVETQRLEGLVFKDLSAPYVLGDKSKELRYWHKFKPDYFEGSSASDLDLVVVGAYFATGLRLAGCISSFLVACVDSDDTSRFVPCCKVSASSIPRELHGKIMNKTGFTSQEGAELELGRWFRDETVPDFVSSKSAQGGNEDGGWRVAKKDFPDLWIHPEDSAVVVINAGEIVYSPAFPLGLSLRFPRITRIRENGADSKEPGECEKDRDLWEIFTSIEAQRSSSEGVAALVPGSPAPSAKYKECRFLTEDQRLADQKKKKSRGTKGVRGVEMLPKPLETESKALAGLCFTVLDGDYSRRESIDMEEARERGWAEEAKLVKSSISVKAFIMKHGGTVRISGGDDTVVLGGSKTDARVGTAVNAMSVAKAQTKKAPKAQTKKALQYQMMAQHEGVLRWTFVYSLVHRWLSKENADRMVSIKDGDPAMLKPTLFDYLVTAGNSEPCFGELFSCTMLRRAMDIVTAFKRKSLENVNVDTSPLKKTRRWQTIALDALNRDDRWIVSCRHQPLWPYTTKGGDSKVAAVVILYPDVFGFDLGLLSESEKTIARSAENRAVDARWKRADSTLQSNGIASVLPLARVMGALVTPYLHVGVTHVLCELGQGTDFVAWTTTTEPSCFRDPTRGQQLLNRLAKLDEDRAGSHAVSLVSVKWIREMWNEGKAVTSA
jgi:hypothetical protein